MVHKDGYLGVGYPWFWINVQLVKKTEEALSILMAHMVIRDTKFLTSLTRLDFIRVFVSVKIGRNYQNIR